MAVVFLLAGCIGLDKIPSRDSALPDDGTTVGGLRVDTTEILFGDVRVGEEVSHDVLFENDGEATTVDALLADAAGVFSVSTTTLTVDGAATLSVGFAPGDVGSFAGTLTLTVGGSDTIVLPISGDGVTDDVEDTDSGSSAGGPALVVDPSSYDFGEADLEQSVSVTFVLANEGDDDLMISDVSPSDNVFAVTGGTLQTPQMISPGGTKTVEVTFTPDAEGTVRGALVVASDDPDGDLEVALTGKGIDACDVCAPIIDVDTGADPYAIDDFFSFFGSEDSRTVTIQNIGDEVLNVTRVFVNNDIVATCGTFTVRGFSSAVALAPWDTTTFDIAYETDGTCLDVAASKFDSNVVHIYSDDPSEPDWVIALSGLGV